MKPRLAAFGNALLDYFHFSEIPPNLAGDFAPGAIHHPSHEKIDELLLSLGDYIAVAGGGATNCARIFRALGGDASFCGCVGTDEEGVFYRRELEETGITTELLERDGRTGRFVVLISRDERLVLVNSGVASELDPDIGLVEKLTAGIEIVHLDGFIATHPANLENLVDKLLKLGKHISFDAGGRKLCLQNRGLFKTIMSVSDYIFVNRDEYEALFEDPVEASLARVSAELPGLLIVKRDAAGAVCWHRGQFVESPVRTVKPLDETGAGDSFAAGFLFGVQCGLPLPVCMRFGNTVASQVISIPGIKVDVEHLKSIARLFYSSS